MKVDSYDSLPIEQMLTLHDVIILIKFLNLKSLRGLGGKFDPPPYGYFKNVSS